MLLHRFKLHFLINAVLLSVVNGCFRLNTRSVEVVVPSDNSAEHPHAIMIRKNSLGMEFVWIPPGKFMMGSSIAIEEAYERYKGYPIESYKSEHPRHLVELTKGFWMSRYEITQKQYQAVMDANPSQTQEDRGDTVLFPVDSITWQNAMDFCEAISDKEGRYYTLPTEAQWEYACRAGTTTEFYWGDEIEQLEKHAWYDKQNALRPRITIQPVGKKLPNSWGLYDMYGNVSEWCLDWYDQYYYANSPNIDPYNDVPKETDMELRKKVHRGGSTVHPDGGCRSASRDWDFFHLTDTTRGFRVVCVDFDDD